MRPYLLAIALLGCFASASALAVDVNKCKYEIDATNAALGMRHFGKSKADLEATLPPRERTVGDPQADFLHTIIDDIYSRPDVADFPYLHYQALVCLTRAQDVAVSIPLSKVADQLVACQTKHGKERSEALTECVLLAVQSHL